MPGWLHCANTSIELLRRISGKTDMERDELDAIQALRDAWPNRFHESSAPGKPHIPVLRTPYQQREGGVFASGA
jgi:hypothetical protein